MSTPETGLEWLLPLDTGERNKQDAQIPLGEEPRLKAAAWVLSGEQRTDTMGVFTVKMGDKRRPRGGSYRPWAPRQF